MTGSDALLALGASARLARLATTDSIAQPVRDRCTSHSPWADDLIHCPFCIGFWLGSSVLAVYAATADRPRARSAWRFATATLALNYAVGHISSRLD